MHIAFFASSLVSCYWNGAATYYRGILRALHDRGHSITFYEPDAYDRQKNRDIPDPPYATVIVYPGNDDNAALQMIDHAKNADLIVKASGVGVYDELLEAAVLTLKTPRNLIAFWDVDAPATLDRVQSSRAGSSGMGVPPMFSDPFAKCIPQYDLILTYGGGGPVINAYKALGAKHCVPIYNALDPATHHPVPPDPRFEGDLAFLGNRLPDREARVEEFFLNPAAKLPGKRFLLGGAGWNDKPMSSNINYLGHVGTADHNALNCTPRAVLNISRESMARYGFSPATRVFEAAGAGACLITDHWTGIDTFFEPEKEILVAHTGDDVAHLLSTLTPTRAKHIGQSALKRVLAHHTYAQRAQQLEHVLATISSPPISSRPTHRPEALTELTT